MYSTRSPKQNRLLAALPEGCYARLLPDLERVAMPLGKVLTESETEFSHIYFPATSIFCMQQVMEDVARAGTAIVGNEGIVGVALYIGDAAMSHRAVVQCGGEAYRIESRVLKVEIDRSSPVLDLLLIHTRALIAQIVYTAACNGQHSLEQRFCRWLLSTLDRHPSKQIGITQELLADILGVRCESIVALVRQLGGDGLIRHGGQWMEVRDRAAVEARSCECYALLTLEVDRLRPQGTQR